MKRQILSAHIFGTMCLIGLSITACDDAPLDGAGVEFPKLERGQPGKADGLPSGWDCSASYYGSDDGCDCGCGAPDPDCLSSDANRCDHTWCSEIDASNSWDCVADDGSGVDDGDSSGTNEAGCPNDDSCRRFTNDGDCDDGGPGSLTSLCPIGTDRIDCGYRYDMTCMGEGATPVVWRAYAQKGDCFGGTGASYSVVVEGENFEIENELQGLLRGTKRRVGEEWPQPAWNKLTATEACYTTCCGPTLVGKTLSMISLAGEESNTVAIENEIP